MLKRIFDLVFGLAIGVISLWLVLLIMAIVSHAVAESQAQQTTSDVIVSVKEANISSNGAMFILDEPFVPDGRMGSPKIILTPLHVVDFSKEIKPDFAKITFQQTVMPKWWLKIAVWNERRTKFEITKVVISE